MIIKLLREESLICAVPRGHHWSSDIFHFLVFNMNCLIIVLIIKVESAIEVELEHLTDLTNVRAKIALSTHDRSLLR